MPTLLLPAFDDTHVAAFRGGDERVFEQLVHARFEPLVTQARAALGADAAGAPRVAVGALLAAWHERERFQTATALDDFLKETLLPLCADERRRRAALHRFEHHEGVPAAASAERTELTADGAWREIASRLHVSAEDIARHREEARLSARRHAREHVETVAARKVPVGALVMGAVFVLAAFGVSRLMDRGGAEVALTRALASGEVRTLQSAPGQRGRITLLDQSTAQLGPASRLLVPKGFANTLRGVQLEGAARFSVTPGGERPFQVRAKWSGVVVTGTDFAVRAYDGEPGVSVLVREGEVQVHPVAGERGATTVGAGEALFVGDDGAVRPLTPAEVTRAFSWLDGVLRLEDVPLDAALAELGRWHALDVALGDSTLATRRVTTTLSLESDAVALDSLVAAAGLAKAYDGKRVVLTTAPPPAPPVRRR